MSDGKEVKRWWINHMAMESSYESATHTWPKAEWADLVSYVSGDDHDRIVARQAKEIGRLHEKWVYYENEHILPCFKWARDMGFVLDVTKNNPENLNSTELFFNLMKTKITQLRAELETTIAELRAEVFAANHKLDKHRAANNMLETTIARQAKVIEKLRERIVEWVSQSHSGDEHMMNMCLMVEDKIFAAIERAEGEKEHE